MGLVVVDVNEVVCIDVVSEFASKNKKKTLKFK